VFVFPSFFEGFGIPPLEAMACGLATIATDVGSDGEVLEQGAGIVINPSKVKSELAFALELLHQHPEFREILKRKARERVIDRYRLETNLSAVEAVYQAVLAQHPTRPSRRSAELLTG
jgi:glycosyltransferase involved in cell wall biosynthesis